MEFFHQPQLPIIFVHFTFTFIFAFISYHELPWLRGVLFAADFHFHIRCSVYNHFHFHWHCQFTGAVLPRPRCDLLRAGGRGGRRCQRPARLLWDPGVRQQGLLRVQGHCSEKNMKIFTVVKFEVENKIVDSSANLTFIGRRRRVRWRELGSERCNTTASASGGGGGGGGASPISWSTLASCNHWRQEMENNDDHYSYLHCWPWWVWNGFPLSSFSSAVDISDDLAGMFSSHCDNLRCFLFGLLRQSSSYQNDDDCHSDEVSVNICSAWSVIRRL